MQGRIQLTATHARRLRTGGGERSQAADGAMAGGCTAAGDGETDRQRAVRRRRYLGVGKPSQGKKRLKIYRYRRGRRGRVRRQLRRQSKVQDQVRRQENKSFAVSNEQAEQFSPVRSWHTKASQCLACLFTWTKLLGLLLLVRMVVDETRSRSACYVGSHRVLACTDFHAGNEIELLKNS